MVSEEQAWRALEWINDRAEDYARACAAVKAAEKEIQVARAMAYRHSIAKTVADRDAESLSSAEYRNAIKKLQDAEFNKQHLGVLIEQRKAVFDYWRTLCANQR